MRIRAGSCLPSGGAFPLEPYQTPFVPSAREAGVSRDLGGTLKFRRSRLRAACILPVPHRFISPTASYFLSAATRSNQETPPRSLRPFKLKLEWVPCASRISRALPTGHPWPVGEGFGMLPGPASARGLFPPHPAMLGAARRGGESTAKADSLHLRHPRAGGNPILTTFSANTPPPNPLPQGEGGLKKKAGPGLLTLLCAVDVPPRLAAPSITARGVGAGACFAPGEAWMPKLSKTGQGWPVFETRRGREAQGTVQSLFDWTAQTSGRRFLVTSFRCRKEVTRRRRNTPVSRREDTGRAQARTPKFQSADLRGRRSKQTERPSPHPWGGGADARSTMVSTPRT